MTSSRRDQPRDSYRALIRSQRDPSYVASPTSQLPSPSSEDGAVRRTFLASASESRTRRPTTGSSGMSRTRTNTPPPSFAATDRKQRSRNTFHPLPFTPRGVGENRALPLDGGLTRATLRTPVPAASRHAACRPAR